ncbi:ATP-grasp domain-containing protein [Variovorax sp. KK3]|nr:ATP-grasp domain-containing protein [Variovorax sp. KK3]
MQPVNVFVFPCGSEVGLEIHRALSQSKHVVLFGGSSATDCGELIFERFVGNLPFAGSDGLLPALQSVIEAWKIDFIFPAHDTVVEEFARWQESGLLGATQVVGSSAAASTLARSKAATYTRLHGVIETPRVYESVDEIDHYPVFLKPDIGQGAKGTFTAYTREAVMFYRGLDPSLLILEHLPGREFTVDCFSDSQGALLFANGRERARILNGISAATKANGDPRFSELARRIHAEVGFRGGWFFQVKERRDGTLVLMEIAARIAGASCFQRIRGVNLALLSLFDRLGMHVDLLENAAPVQMDRCLQNRFRLEFEYDIVYVDLDDTVLLSGRPNFRLLASLYALKDQGKELVLLTRHRARHGRAPSDSLDGAAVHPALFDRIIDVAEDESKSAKIATRRAIFIDDSFRERRDVAIRCRVPVFDLSEAIEIFG